VTRRVCEKIAQNVAQPFFRQYLCKTFTMEKVDKKCGQLLSLKKPKGNNHSLVKNSPNPGNCETDL
jgi:hypothetical protein